MTHACSVYDTDPHFEIDAVTRAVKNVSQTKTMLVQFDHNSERFTFELPRTIDGHDMTQSTEVQVHYLNIDAATREQYPGIYEVQDLQPSSDKPDVVVFSWLISGNATQHVGPLAFVIRFVCTNNGVVTYAWNTVVHSAVQVVKGIYNSEVIVEEYADILEQWRQELVESGGVSDERIAQAVEDYMAEHPASGGLSATASELLITILRNVKIYSTDQSGNIAALATELGVTEVAPDEPEEPEVNLSSISVTYSGGDVAVGTAVSELTGIVVTAHYSDGTRGTVTEYTLSGTIAEGTNIITVSYGGLTTTFTVTGVAEEPAAVYVYSLELGNAILIKAGASAAMGGTVGLSGGQATSRRTFLAKTGVEELWCISSTSPYGKWEEECYPIPIPADATGLNISVPGYVPGPALYSYVDDTFTRTLDAGWQASGSYSLTFEPGTYQYLSVNTKTTNGGVFSTEPTNYVVEFTK